MSRTIFRLAIIGLLAAGGLLAGTALSQTAAGAGHLVIIVPFENLSKAPGLDWIGEAFPEVLGQRFSSGQYYVIARPDRLYAFDRLGIPVNTRPSRATLLRIAEEMDVDYLVTGSYTFDGKSFMARGQVMDVKHYHLSPEMVESGALTQLVEVQNALAWDLLRGANPGFNVAKDRFVSSQQGVRLDALENYIRGLLANERLEKIKYLKEAIRLNPEYAQPLLQLGRAYYESKEYESAINWLSKVPKNQPTASEANFYLGLSAFYVGKYERAAEAFAFTAATVPLIEVYNNLGVVAARSGKKSAGEYFQRAVAADSRDSDYRFNLAVSLYRENDLNAAARQLRECLAIRSQDAEAKQLLETINTRIAGGSGSQSAASARPPLERIKRNYDETSYRQLALELQSANELRFGAMPAAEHAAKHVLNGEGLLQRGLPDQAENDFREAILLDPTNASAHMGLGRVLASRGELQQARMEASSATRLQPTAGAYLLLASIELTQHEPEVAQEDIDRALKLEPDNSAAAAMKRDVAAQIAAKTGPDNYKGKRSK